MITRIKGTQDVLDLCLYTSILEKAKKYLHIYNFTEIATPLIEPLELFRRSLGLQTDVVSKEMYQVIADNSNESSEKLCLRPELTASIMRAFVNAGIQETPWKVFSVGPAFRHERPQKGRYRQFNQLSMEVIGSNSLRQDVLFIAMLDLFFSQIMDLKGYVLYINYLGNRQDRLEHQTILKLFLDEHSPFLCDLCTTRREHNIMRVFDCKEQTCQELYKNAPTIIDSLSQASANEWQMLKDGLQELAILYTVQPTLVRGLDYYNKTVFEFVSLSSDGLGTQNTFCGGGRYDSLAAQLGASHDYPSIGAAIGMERLQLVLEAQKGLVVRELEQKKLCVVIPLTVEQQPLALHILQLLHSYDLCADIILDKSTVKSMFKAADKMNAQWSVLIGPDEQTAGTVTLKNMITGEEQAVPQHEIITHIR